MFGHFFYLLFILGRSELITSCCVFFNLFFFGGGEVSHFSSLLFEVVDICLPYRMDLDNKYLSNVVVNARIMRRNK